MFFFVFKIKNLKNKGAYGSFDMNVEGAWALGYTGKGVVVSILDDGIQPNHPDLVKNYVSFFCKLEANFYFETYCDLKKLKSRTHVLVMTSIKTTRTRLLKIMVKTSTFRFVTKTK